MRWPPVDRKLLASLPGEAQRGLELLEKVRRYHGNGSVVADDVNLRLSPGSQMRLNSFGSWWVSDNARSQMAARDLGEFYAMAPGLIDALLGEVQRLQQAQLGGAAKSDQADAALFGKLIAAAVKAQPYSSSWGLVGRAVEGTALEPSDTEEIPDLVNRISAISLENMQ